MNTAVTYLAQFIEASVAKFEVWKIEIKEWDFWNENQGTEVVKKGKGKSLSDSGS